MKMFLIKLCKIHILYSCYESREQLACDNFGSVPASAYWVGWQWQPSLLFRTENLQNAAKGRKVFSFVSFSGKLFLVDAGRESSFLPWWHISYKQGFGSVFIFYGSGSGSRGSGWRPIRIRIRIRIQSGSRALMTKNWKKKNSWKKNFNFFWSKTAIYLSLGPGLWIRIHFLRIRIRIQTLMLETNPDPDPIRIQAFPL